MKHVPPYFMTIVLLSACSNPQVSNEVPGVRDVQPSSAIGDELDGGSGSGTDGEVGDGSGAGGDNGSGDGGGSVSGPSAEVCDGFDNDRDGDIDEDTAGEPCGEGGTTRCIAGSIVCNECTPGTTRTEDCGCEVERTDICNDAGRWVNGSCGSCDEVPLSCLEAGACVPGTTRIRRCDQCTGPDCGASCVGAEFECTEECEWVQVGGCEARNPTCDRDLTLYEPCGRCGTEVLECDGCFWDSDGCTDQGVCTPGDSRAAACGGDQCGDGLSGTETCTDSCEWRAPETCEGCVIGDMRTEREPCLSGEAGCGERIVQFECIEAGSTTSCDGTTTRTGRWRETVIADCDIECRPGETRSANCQTMADTCGSFGQVCTGTCQWSGQGPGVGGNGVCEERADACTPGEVRLSEQRSCGANSCGATFTYEEVCRSNGCGFETARGSCPACVAGQTDSRRCTTAAGECGNRMRTCTTDTCEWGGFGACVASPESCVEGTSRTESCSAQCGAAGERTLRCNGCGWDAVSECEPIDPQVCEPGEVLDLGVCPLCPTQRRERRCSTSCEWVETSCGVCG